ncbi:MAG: hypothetical protein SNJ56_07160 [Termitinemataceae bacterium]
MNRLLLTMFAVLSFIFLPLLLNAVPSGSDVIQIHLSNTAMSTRSSAQIRSLQIRFSNYSTEGLVTWTIQVIDLQGRPYKTWRGARFNLDQFPAQITFNGVSDTGELLLEGEYKINVVLGYQTGVQIQRTSVSFSIINTQPYARVRSNNSTLTIGSGSQNLAELIFYHDVSSDAEWKGFIRDAQGNVIKTFRLPAGRDPLVRWRGDTDQEQLAQPGLYFYVAEGVNSVGLRGKSQEIPIRIVKHSIADLALVPAKSVFSPYAEYEGEIKIFIQHNSAIPLENYQFTITSNATHGPWSSIAG